MDTDELRDLSAAAARYHGLFWIWFAFGFPAFPAVLGIFSLMIARPALTII